VDIASSSKQVFESRAVTPHPKPNYVVVNDSPVLVADQFRLPRSSGF
jgi:hypothetical protein